MKVAKFASWSCMRAQAHVRETVLGLDVALDSHEPKLSAPQRFKRVGKQAGAQ